MTNRPSSFAIGTNVTLTLIFAGFLVGAVNYFSSRHYKTFDLSDSKYYTLSDKTLTYIKGLKEPLKLYSFFGTEHPLADRTLNLLKSYRDASGGKIEMEVVDPYSDIVRARQLAEKFKFTEQDNVVILSWKDKSKFVNADSMAEYDSPNQFMGGPPKLRAFKGENEITSAMVALLEGKPSKVYFLKGHGGADIDDNGANGFAELNNRIQRENIQTEVLDLALKPEIPADAQLLVLAGPEQPIRPEQLTLLENYLQKNGRLLLLFGPGSKSGLEPLLEKYRIKADNNYILGETLIVGVRRLIATVPIAGYGANPVVDKLKGVTMVLNSARSVRVDLAKDEQPSDKAVELLLTPETYWGETELNAEDASFTQGSDLKGPLSVAVAVDTGKAEGEGVDVEGSRLIVVGTASSFTNSQLLALPGASDFIVNSVNWLLKKESSIGIAAKTTREYAINVTPAQAQTLALVIIGVLPLSILAIGVGVWYQRRS